MTKKITLQGIAALGAVLVLALAGCSSDDAPPPAVATATATHAPLATQTRVATTLPSATQTAAAAATSTAQVEPTETPEVEPTETPETEATETPAGEATPTSAGETPTPTPTQSGNPSYVGAYFGPIFSDGSPFGAVRFDVAADGSASGFLDFYDAGSSAGARGGAAQVISISFPMSGNADLDTGAFALSGSFGPDSPFTVDGTLPSGSGSTGTFVYTVGDFTLDGQLFAGGPPPTATPTPTPNCESGDLAMDFSNVSGDFNGISSDFVVSRMGLAGEQSNGTEGQYNAFFNGTECTQEGVRLRNVQINIFAVSGGIASGQSFPLGSNAIVYYGEAGSGGDRVWSSSAGTVFIDSVSGSVVQLRVVGAAMTVPAGAAVGSFTLDVAGQVNNFVHD